MCDDWGGKTQKTKDKKELVRRKNGKYKSTHRLELDQQSQQARKREKGEKNRKEKVGSQIHDVEG
jgi:hypothetical protein